MHPAEVVIWLFLAVFALTAAIALGGLVGWIPLESYYRKNLFRLLILEVVGCVVGFGAQSFRSLGTPRADLRATMLRNELGWNWQYAEKGWRGRLRFEDAGGRKLKMVGSMRLVGLGAEAVGQDGPILTWETSEPFEVPARAEAVTFKGTRTWTEGAARVYPELRWEVGKKTDVSITVRIDEMLRGAVTNAPAETWTLMLTPGLP